MKVKEMWNLDEDAVAALKALPETGMGFQLVEGSFWGRVAPLLVFNTERAYDLSTIGLEPGDDPATILTNGLKIVELLKSEIARTIIAAPSARIHGLLGSRIGTPPAVPAATAAAGIVTALPSSLVLAEVPGREVVMGAVTQPWHANVGFRSLPPDAFVAFNEPDYVKIVWTLRADSTGPRMSVFRSETRVVTTNASARAKFRWYWARFSPGILLIRRLSLGPLRRDAERRAQRTFVSAHDTRTA